jgi:serralysin
MPSPSPSLIARLVAVVVALIAGTLSVPFGAAGATEVTASASNPESAFVSALNQERSSRGLSPLIVDVRMTNAARDWAEEMADRSTLVHAPDITVGAPDGWRKVGENIGRGSGVTGLVSAFMNSPGHRANVLDPAFTRIGVGVAHTSRGELFTAHRFAATRNPEPTCMGRRATIIAQRGHVTVGTSGDDVIIGTRGDDIIRSGRGNDVICSLGGDDRVSSGRGADRVDAGRGNDVVRGRGGADLLQGGNGTDKLLGGNGRDHLDGETGSDDLRGGRGRDTCSATDADSTRSCTA